MPTNGQNVCTWEEIGITESIGGCGSVEFVGRCIMVLVVMRRMTGAMLGSLRVAMLPLFLIFKIFHFWVIFIGAVMYCTICMQSVYSIVVIQLSADSVDYVCTAAYNDDADCWCVCVLLLIMRMLTVDVCVLQAAYDPNQALVLCQMNDFRAGVLYLYEKMKLYVRCTSLLLVMCKTADSALSLFCEFVWMIHIWNGNVFVMLMCLCITYIVCYLTYYSYIILHVNNNNKLIIKYVKSMSYVYTTNNLFWLLT